MWVPYDKLRHEEASHYCERQRPKFDDLPENFAKYFAQRRELVLLEDDGTDLAKQSRRRS
jgi:hypothetical protein